MRAGNVAPPTCTTSSSRRATPRSCSSTATAGRPPRLRRPGRRPGARQPRPGGGHRHGRVLFEWSAFDTRAAGRVVPGIADGSGPWDPYHLNSVAMDEDGDLLVSARHTWAVYKIDPETGDVVWRLGGKRSDFELGPGVRFSWQHDARWRQDGTLSLFDNQAASPELVETDRLARHCPRLDEQAGTSDTRPASSPIPPACSPRARATCRTCRRARPRRLGIQAAFLRVR